ncbi:MAG: copper amine oxidase N-terminal domain-containing protein, partial [Bacillota bacterium]|nr:copper amine oxidase N-terminal domain-containing protein [Bacillota bacterium]
MKKVLAFFILIVFLPIYTLSAQNINVIIDGKTVSFNESTGYPFIDKGRTMVPLRGAMEAFGAQVSWNPQENAAKVVKDSTTVKCVIGEGCIYRNGVKISNDASAVIASSRTYLPIRAVLEAFGSEVSWDGSVKVKTESGQIISKIEGSGSHVSNIWAAWNAAMKLFESQNYEAAAASFTALTPDFLALKDINSSAILYHHLGDCYSSLGNYQMASACYLRESDFWAVAGKNDETIDSKRRSNLISTSHRLYIETD